MSRPSDATPPTVAIERPQHNGPIGPSCERRELVTLGRRACVSALALVCASATSCSDNDTSPRAATTTSTSASPGSPGSLETIPARPGRVELTIGDTTYRAEIPNCSLDTDTDTLDFLALDTHEGESIRIEYGAATGQQLGLFIGADNPLDPGHTSWIGTPGFELNNSTATATPFDMTNTNDGTTAEATAEVTCE